jgi:phenylalanyl-tRNA synthetase beta chain
MGGFSLDPVLGRAPETLKARDLPTQPPVFRDISMALPVDVSARDVERVIRDAGGEFLESVELIDVYEGEQVGEGRRSLAYRLTFRASDRTLRAEEADAVRTAIVEACRERLGAEIR